MKRNKVLYDIRRKLQVLAIKVTSPSFVSKMYFKYVLGYKLNLASPQSLNEKLQWLKLNYWAQDKNAIMCADKYAVREYIMKKGKVELLNDLLFVWDDVSQIDWDSLPQKFVLKCNHGCGYNIICEDKTKLDKKTVLHTLDKWMHEDFSLFNAEPHYAKIERKIICEKFLEGEVINYNIYVFNGKAQFFSVAGGLGVGEGEHLTYYNPDGSVASFKNRSYPTKEKTLSPLLPEMITTAEFLAQGFPMVRVDLFDISGRIVLSELTFTPGGALIPFEPREADFSLGEQLDISNLINEAKTNE